MTETIPSRLYRSGSLEELGKNGRIVRYVLSTPAVGRDMHTVAADAWQLGNYLRNPVFLWAHDDRQPPIGRMVEIGDVGGVLKGNVEYAERELNPFGDTIYRLVQAGYINAVSTSWAPIDWTFSKDRDRPKGVDFRKVDMLEVSQVPIPALPGALAEARSRGIDTGPIFEWAERILDGGGRLMVPRSELEELRRAAKMPAATTQRRRDMASWKVGASRNLPIEDSDSWDGSAAEKSIFEYAGGDDFDPAKAQRGFLVYDADAPEKRGSYKLPIAHAVDGELKVPKGAIRAALSRIPDADIPDGVKERAQSVLDAYAKKAGIGDDKDEEKRALRQRHKRVIRIAPPVPTFRRGLYGVAQLACMLEDLGYAHSCAEYEADIEGDESEVPAMIAESLKTLAEALLAMTQEEVAELLGAHLEDDEEMPDGVEERALPPAERAFIAAAKTPRARAWRRGIVLARAGRTLSAANKDKLEAVSGHHERAMKHHRAMAEHYQAVSGHLEELRAIQEKAAEAHGKVSDALTKAKENPGAAAEHVKRAMSQCRSVAGHLEAMDEKRGDIADRHADAGDSHAALGRSVKAAQKGVRSVIDGSAPAADDDEDDQSGDDNSDDENGDTDEEKERRRRRARALQLRQEPAA